VYYALTEQACCCAIWSECVACQMEGHAPSRPRTQRLQTRPQHVQPIGRGGSRSVVAVHPALADATAVRPSKTSHGTAIIVHARFSPSTLLRRTLLRTAGRNTSQGYWSTIGPLERPARSAVGVLAGRWSTAGLVERSAVARQPALSVPGENRSACLVVFPS